MKFRQRVFIFLVVATLVLSYQNCSIGNGNSFSNVESPGGNGQPYEGKPDPGDYYRLVPDFVCGPSRTPTVAEVIQVDLQSTTLVTTSAATCTERRQIIATEDLESQGFNRKTLGFLDGIYEKRTTRPDPQGDLTETWCRSVAGEFDTVIKRGPAGAYIAEVRTASGLEKNFTPSRSLAGANLNYSASDLSLSITLSAASAYGILRGHVNSIVNGSAVNGDVNCRTTLPPVDNVGLFVLSANTTQGNLGGLTGADAFCLNELSTNDFKGKSSFVIDSSHVFAFLCDSTRCNNLPANSKFMYAVAGNRALGGLTFTTNAAGSGPGNYVDWSSPGAFGIADIIWSAREGDPATGINWYTVPGPQHCADWSTNSNAQLGSTGNTEATAAPRWDNGGNICADVNRLVCYVIR